jgi:hypothetical protein
MKHLKKFSTEADRIAYERGNDYIEPYISLVSEDSSVHYNSWADDYFTTIARESGTISFNIWQSMGTDMITSISYSTDNGETWTTTNNTNNKSENIVIAVNVSEGDKVLWKGGATQFGYYDEDDYGDTVGSFFSSTCEFDAQGNVMSLLYGDDFKGKTTIENDYAFVYLFSDYDEENECKVVNARNLSLPATTLAAGCYSYMFNGCTSLTSAPQLPATTLAAGCYSYMFNGCTSLTLAPKLPATTLAEYCYSNMFRGCTNLTTAPELLATTLTENCYEIMFWGCTSLTAAPELPATTLTNSCYAYMFDGCTSLTAAPELPATTLANSCYFGMFRDCTNLTTAPELPATILVSSCYSHMFEGCTNLKHIKAMFTTTPSSTYTQYWVNRVASNGTFVKNSAAQWNVTGNNGIPTGWTVQTASE